MPKSYENEVAPREAFGQFENLEGGTVEVALTAKKAPAEAARVSKAKSQVRFPESESEYK